MVRPVNQLLKDLSLLLKSRYLDIPLLVNHLLSVSFLPWSLSPTGWLSLLGLAWLPFLLSVGLTRIGGTVCLLLLLLLRLLLQQQELLLLLLQVE